MHRVRYYSRLIEPSYFEGKGIRGWLVRALNKVRFWIETKVCHHVMVILAKEDGHDRHTISHLSKAFRQDVKEERELLTKKPEPVVDPRTMDVAEELERRPRHLGSRRNTEAMIARMMAGPRQRRYTSAKVAYGDPDGDFDEVAGEEDGRDTESPRPIQAETPHAEDDSGDPRPPERAKSDDGGQVVSLRA